MSPIENGTSPIEKGELAMLPYLEIVKLQQEVIHQADIDAVLSSLNPQTIESILRSLHYAYIHAHVVDDSEAKSSTESSLVAAYPVHTLNGKSERNQSFFEKKDAVRNCLSNLHSKGLIDGKLIFELGVFLAQDKKTLSSPFNQFVAGSFWEDIKQWLFEHKPESIRNTIDNPKQAIINQESTELVNTLEQKPKTGLITDLLNFLSRRRPYNNGSDPKKGSTNKILGESAQ